MTSKRNKKGPLRKCIVCGNQTRFPKTTRMCKRCSKLSAEVRREIREKRRKKGIRSSVYAISGGLPSLGKRQ